MNPYEQNSKTSLTTSVILLLAGVVILAFFTSHATLSVDPPNRYLVAKSLVDHGDLRIRLLPNEAVPPGTFIGKDGYRYSHFGVGQSLIFAAPYWLCRHILGIHSDKLIRSIISITIFPFTLGLTAVAFFGLIRQFGFTKRQGYLAAILVIFATGLWQVSKEGQEDCHLALCFALMALGLRRYQLYGSIRSLALSAGVTGMAFLIRSDIAPTVILYLIFAGWLIYTQGRRIAEKKTRLLFHLKSLLVVISLTIPALIVHSWIYYSHFGRWLTPPYDPFSLSYMPMGLKGLLFSPGRSVFLYNPIIVLAIPGIILLWRTGRRDWTLFVSAAFVGCLLLHAALNCFHGNCCWGPRYLTRQFPLLFIPITFAMFHFWRPRSVQQHSGNKIAALCGRGAAGGAVVLSLLIQIIAVSGHHALELFQLQAAYRVQWSDRQWTMFEPEAHFLSIRLANLRQDIGDMANDRIGPWDSTPNHLLRDEEKIKAPVLHYLAFWPYHMTYYLPVVKPQYAIPLWGSTLILLSGIAAGFGLLIWGWRHIIQSEI